MEQDAPVTKLDVLKILRVLSEWGEGSLSLKRKQEIATFTHPLLRPLLSKLISAANIHPEELTLEGDLLDEKFCQSFSGLEAMRLFLLALLAMCLRTGEGDLVMDKWQRRLNSNNPKLGRLKKNHLTLDVVETSLCQRLAKIDPIPIVPKPFQNKLGMTFLHVDQGKFQMGTEIGGWGATDKEHPPCQIKITKPFYLSQCLVTQEQWRALLPNAADPSHFYGPELPVDSVSWNHAQVFCKKLNQLEKTTAYRLPSEAEWEYACRSGTDTPFFCEEKDLQKYAWIKPNGEGKSHPVAQLKPNPWGFYDMLGNLLEWCSEEITRSDYHLDREPQFNPTKRVLRGGCWRSFPKAARSAVRTFQLPNYQYYAIGFRIVRNLE